MEPQKILDVLRAMAAAFRPNAQPSEVSFEALFNSSVERAHTKCLTYLPYATILEAAKGTHATLTQVEEDLGALAERDKVQERPGLYYALCAQPQMIKRALEANGNDLDAWPHISQVVAYAMSRAKPFDGVMGAGDIFPDDPIRPLIGNAATKQLILLLNELQLQRKLAGERKEDTEILARNLELAKADFEKKFNEVLEENVRIRDQAGIIHQKQRVMKVEEDLGELFTNYPDWIYHCSNNGGFPFVTFGIRASALDERTAVRLDYIHGHVFRARLDHEQAIEAREVLEKVGQLLQKHNFLPCRVRPPGKLAPALERATGSIVRGSGGIFAFYFDTPARLRD